ncbi:hypothetical protein RGR602_PC00277 (plasmid) [Rhizobium gallicum bv. gallicum R602sp]|uniref:Uncharacterized protein n=1 Tax=Rhizobium gallicum bv. gallicum R602sp TaxID=1041138 RepID=A0A0B4XC09_9HYPH|nr:hypothetical protein [Rhizobium gallicum]AJD44320.1 hypothetical protein RGR602_PC00277 [Rhizobium gallicum bv. gallicum R602sp]
MTAPPRRVAPSPNGLSEKLRSLIHDLAQHLGQFQALAIRINDLNDPCRFFELASNSDATRAAADLSGAGMAMDVLAVTLGRRVPDPQ